MTNKIHYLDNSATTKLDERVLEEMKPYFLEHYAVATSEFGYSMGLDAREALDNARESLAKCLEAPAEDMAFTSGDTESSNMALKGVTKALRKKGSHVIISKIEDFPVLNSARTLEQDGLRVTYLDVDGEGLLDLDKLQSSIAADTVLVSVQHANQEIGTVQDIKAIADICHDKKVLYHADATHTFRRLPLDVSRVPVDLLTISAHTIHGPRGVGGLYIRGKTPISKWMDGGFQESNRRAGLENIPGAIGFAKAASLVTEEENIYIRGMRDRLIRKVLDTIPDTMINGSATSRTPQNANITFHYVEGESMTLHLDMSGFEVSTGSACFSRTLEASHVIMGIGGNHERAHGSIRFSFSRFNTTEDVDAVVESISAIVANLRRISPLKK
ncbi:MAG: cysteine desulfurase [Methanomassiliicoccus sp.]|jgi:cysteine desulfurase|nr:cysteine desulfurase [Methanomassiliicoccus sp.]